MADTNRMAGALWAFVLAIGSCSAAFAQAFPARPVHVIVPFPPGGPVDVLARALGEGFRERTGQPFVVESKPGANTAIGAAACKNAEPDGYTMCLLSSSSITLNPFLYANLSYDPLKDLAPVTNVVMPQQMAILHNSVPARSMKELVAYSQANPDKLNYATFGVGGEGHLVTEWIKAQTGARITHVPFTGAAPALLAFERGDVHFIYLVAAPALVEKVRSGQARGLMVSGAMRNPLLPDVPSLKETGLPVLAFESWFGMLAPARTPTERIDKLSRELAAVIKSETFLAKYARPNSYLPIGNTPAEFRDFILADKRRGEDLVQKSGVKLKQQ